MGADAAKTHPLVCAAMQVPNHITAIEKLLIRHLEDVGLLVGTPSDSLEHPLWPPYWGRLTLAARTSKTKKRDISSAIYFPPHGLTHSRQRGFVDYDILCDVAKGDLNVFP